MSETTSRQLAMVMDLNKCIGCHTCTVACKTQWTNRNGREYMYWNNVETHPGQGYPRKWEDSGGGFDAAGNLIKEIMDWDTSVGGDVIIESPGQVFIGGWAHNQRTQVVLGETVELYFEDPDGVSLGPVATIDKTVTVDNSMPLGVGSRAISRLRSRRQTKYFHCRSFRP